MKRESMVRQFECSDFQLKVLVILVQMQYVVRVCASVC